MTWRGVNPDGGSLMGGAQDHHAECIGQYRAVTAEIRSIYGNTTLSLEHARSRLLP